MYQYFIKPLLFLLTPELAHTMTMRIFSVFTSVSWLRQWIKPLFCVPDPRLQRQLWNLTFPNPVGLAAGFDKDGKYIEGMSCLGFGFIEIGTVTPRAQAGNDKPRLFRLPKDHAVINRMGFNNGGVTAAAQRLKQRSVGSVIIGGNIGKNKVTSNEDAVNDYLMCFRELYAYVDYFVVNVSSPNTPGLRELQEKKPLTELLQALVVENKKMPNEKPILLKIAPDLSRDQLDDIIDIVLSTGIHGIIATNTTLDRELLTTNVGGIGAGGLSGRPLRDKSTDIIRYLHTTSGGRIPIIGVGGIDSPEAAIEKLNAGASLVQVYTGLIYEGPFLVRKINKALLIAE